MEKMFSCLPDFLIKNESMESSFTVTCPYCGEQVSIQLEPDVAGDVIQDCEVCCRPWLIRIEGEGGERTLTVTRGDGSE
jgi:hypothetical protein